MLIVNRKEVRTPFHKRERGDAVRANAAVIHARTRAVGQRDPPGTQPLHVQQYTGTRAIFGGGGPRCC